MRKISILIVILAFVLGSCTERIDINLGTTYTRFIVEGKVTTDTMAQTVKLTKSTDYYFSTPPPAVTNAVVTLDDGVQKVTLNESDSIPGLYETTSGYYGVPGRTYDLEIQLPEAINGNSTFTASSKMPSVAPIDSIGLEYQENFNAYFVKIYAQEPPSIDFYSFEVFKNDTLLTDSLDKLGISDDRLFNGNYTYGIPVYFLDQDKPSETIQPGDTITLRMSGITKDYYNFVLQLQDQTFQYRNPLFSGPPANISTNISNGGLGFFAATAVTYSTTVLKE